MCNEVDGHDNSTALMLAAYNNNSQIVAAILADHRCSFDIENWYGWTVDDIAFLNDLEHIQEVLNNDTIRTRSEKYSPRPRASIKRFSTKYFYNWLFLFNGILPFGIVGWLFWDQAQASKREKEEKEQEMKLKNDEEEITRL